MKAMKGATLTAGILLSGVLLSAGFFAGHATAPVAIPIQLEMLAIVTAAACGVITAREHKLDLVGAVGLAVMCALGGGLLRDIILQVHDVYILNQPLALPIAIVTATVVFVFPQLVENQDRLVAILDIFSVGLYSAIGADKAMVYGLQPLVCVMMGFFTGVGGGMLRDVFLGETPYIFKRGNLYAIASIAGASVYVLLVEAAGVMNIIALAACVAVTMALRYLSIRYNIMSPTEIDIAGMAEPVVRQVMHPSKRAQRIKRKGRAGKRAGERNRS